MRDWLRRRFLQEKVAWHDYLTAVALALFGIAIVYVLEHVTVEHFSNIASILIIAVLLSAVLFGTGPAVLTALACSFLYDWLLVPPLFTAAAGFDNLIKFGVFIAAALLTGAIAGLAKRYAVALGRRERELTAALNEQDALRRENQREVTRRELEALRSAVLAAVSHDLKTPLTSIIGSMSSLQIADRQLGPADRQALIASMTAEAHRLLGYMSGILDLARFEDADDPPLRQVVSVDDVVDLSVKRLAARLRPFRLAVQVDDELCFRGDERLMDIALGNILDNAIKHSAGSTDLSIRTEPSGDDFAIVVEDQGAGLAPELRDRVLARGGDASISDLGAGLGLWIARRIVEAHGGAIALHSPAAGGTRVALHLPRAQRPLLASEPA